MTEQVYPEPTVGAIVFNPDGKILLAKSPKWHGYMIPGGHIELGESAENALKREFKEEVGLDLYDCKLVATQECIFDPVFVKKKHFIFLDFMAKTNDRDVKIDNHEIIEYIWVKPEEALRINVDQYTKATIKKCIELLK